MRAHISIIVAGRCLQYIKNLPSVLELIPELNDFWDTSEVLDESDNAAEGLPSKVIDRCFSVIKLFVRDPIQEFVDQPLHPIDLESNGVRAHLFVIADDDDFLAQTKSGEPQDITL